MGAAQRVAVLGAGMAGAIAARRLAEAGLSVTVFDKGRGPGGRMATRRTGDGALSFDHGAQFLRAHGDAFSRQLADWRMRGVVGDWDAVDGAVGTPGMTAPVRDLLAGIEIRSGRTVTGIARSGSGWRLAVTADPDDTVFEALAVGFPAPQVAALLAAGGLSLPGLDRAAYAPCWSVMLACGRDCAVPGGALADAGGPIGQIFREDTKPGRSTATVRLVVHAAPAWSRAHLEEAPEDVADAVIQAIRLQMDATFAPLHVGAHRWRYALVETALDQDCLYDPSLRLGACGDWCLGPRVEAAYDSGSALAARIIADLT